MISSGVMVFEVLMTFSSLVSVTFLSVSLVHRDDVLAGLW